MKLSLLKSGRGVVAPAIVLAAALAVLPQSSQAAECGKASWYRMGKVTASGEAMDPSALAAAHRTLPFGTRVEVRNLANDRSVIVRINDRGPFVGGRIIDVTEGAAKRLGMIKSGVARVEVTVLDGKAAGKTSRACG